MKDMYRVHCIHIHSPFVLTNSLNSHCKRSEYCIRAVFAI